MTQLYNLEQKYIQLINMVEEAEGELTPDIELALTIHQEGLSRTIPSYHSIMEILQSNIDLADKQIKRAKEFKESKEKSLERFKKELLKATLLYGQEDNKGVFRLDFDTIRLSTRRSKFIDVFDEGSLGEEHLKIDLSNLDSLQYKKIIGILPELANTGKYKISKTSIKEALDKGIEVNGAKEETNFSLTIK